MLNWLKKVIDELFTPSPQKDDWYGWTTNQISHAFLGLFAFWSLLFLGAHGIVAFFVPLAIMVIKEIIDLLRGGSSLWDSITDFSFVLYGVIVAFSSWVESGTWFLWVNVFMSCVLLYGIHKRITQKDNAKRG